MKKFMKGLWKLFRDFGRGFMRLLNPPVKGAGSRILERRYAEVPWQSIKVWRLIQLLEQDTRLRVTCLNLRITVLVRVEGNILRMCQWGPGKGNTWFAQGDSGIIKSALGRLQTNTDAWVAMRELADKLRANASILRGGDKEKVLRMMEQ